MIVTDQAKQDMETSGAPSSVDAERREALRKLGKYAAYTAPAMLTMLTSEAAAQTTGTT